MNSKMNKSTTELQKPPADSSAPVLENRMLPAVFVGQVLYRERTSRHSPTEITEHTVTKIGRKYFEATGLNDKINISNLKYESPMYSQHNYQLYLSKQQILDRQEMNSLYNKIQNLFSHYSNRKFTLDELRKVAEIVGCL